MRLCRLVCDPGNRCKNKKRDGTECGAALDKESKHATTCPCGRALSAKHNALRDEIANIARRTGLCADIEVLVDHPAIDPENGARMDVRISNPNQVSKTPTSLSTFKGPPRSVWRQLVWWAKPLPSPRARNEQNTDPQSSPRPSSRRTVVWAPHSKRSWPRSHQKISKPGPPGCRKP